jgi:hypothetical protein
MFTYFILYTSNYDHNEMTKYKITISKINLISPTGNTNLRMGVHWPLNISEGGPLKLAITEFCCILYLSFMLYSPSLFYAVFSISILCCILYLYLTIYLDVIKSSCKVSTSKEESFVKKLQVAIKILILFNICNHRSIIVQSVLKLCSIILFLISPFNQCTCTLLYMHLHNGVNVKSECRPLPLLNTSLNKGCHLFWLSVQEITTVTHSLGNICINKHHNLWQTYKTWD